MRRGSVRPARRGDIPFLSILLGLLACETPADTRHEAYARGLREAGLAELPAGGAWIEAGRYALLFPEPAELPLQAEGWFSPDSPAAVAWRLPVRDGQHLTVRARLHGEAAGRLFIEVFRVPRDAGDELFAMASADDTTSTIEVEATRTADVIVRLQPELLRGGRYEVEVDVNGTPAGLNRAPGRPLFASRAGRP